MSEALSRSTVYREEIVNTVEDKGFGIVEKPLGLWERLLDNGAVRKGIMLVLLAIVWEAYARWSGNPLLFPTFVATAKAFFSGIASGTLLSATWTSISLLLQGYAAGLLIAALFTAFASATRVGADLLETLTSMFNPLPSIALLPLSMIWFGLGNASIIFVLIHAVLWAVALNTHSGFRSVSLTWRMVGRNYGLSRLQYVLKILIPGAFPSILTGMKIGWAFAWRTLIAAELVFGSSSGSGGLGWYIFQNKNMLDIPNVFAGLLTVILFGLLVENLIFRVVERRTIGRWGMQT
ncbi:ABC transporter permease [Pollutimonas sp. M17]|uniref:ABC transporter permease n=1 Tax=Pollutimonas sp. M17 TaxID=2962065 RepID=UPI0021F4DC0B|nr:ABC transporter permease [Pollutimonas sp. M17]UYO93183.1 ABC transporter permease [Pollutimonas sp. M17]HWK72397.1 ABC transporter permease [Burkholderiaceae bacterium]